MDPSFKTLKERLVRKFKAKKSNIYIYINILVRNVRKGHSQQKLSSSLIPDPCQSSEQKNKFLNHWHLDVRVFARPSGAINLVSLVFELEHHG